MKKIMENSIKMHCLAMLAIVGKMKFSMREKNSRNKKIVIFYFIILRQEKNFLLNWCFFSFVRNKHFHVNNSSPKCHKLSHIPFLILSKKLLPIQAILYKTPNEYSPFNSSGVRSYNSQYKPLDCSKQFHWDESTQGI